MLLNLSIRQRPEFEMSTIPRSRLTRRAALYAVAAVLAFATAPGLAQEPQSLADAQEAAERWLAQADSGNYAATWRDAAGPFRSVVTQAQWEASMRAVRTPLGAAGERALQSATFQRTLPGAPDGQYVVLQYSTQFANKESAVETITPMLDQDGSWRVSGYQIR
ncbi:DUF4019 domain-containing protein [Massilia buxea]|uniref:DUF4019 domain-containing protein n=2 Tax=Pseudoduganella buxea TaxID=1949069 RepID=A0A6I3SZ99_9BURK|nr:DUF4019 domain-containing protein [Pseudoduganella buxea]